MFGRVIFPAIGSPAFLAGGVICSYVAYEARETRSTTDKGFEAINTRIDRIDLRLDRHLLGKKHQFDKCACLSSVILAPVCFATIIASHHGNPDIWDADSKSCKDPGRRQRACDRVGCEV